MPKLEGMCDEFIVSENKFYARRGPEFWALVSPWGRAYAAAVQAEFARRWYA